jgi:hypothetical protein
LEAIQINIPRWQQGIRSYTFQAGRSIWQIMLFMAANRSMQSKNNPLHRSDPITSIGWSRAITRKQEEFV